ncbi:MAG: transcriptional repressor [Firmicutes bacterium]|nr:transcriptional repressor [Bacillota bacterium]
MKEDIARGLLRRAGLRCTTGRVRILEVLQQAEGPMTHQEILQAVAPVGLNRVSVYRALDAFQEADIIHRVDMGDRVWRFALCLPMGNTDCHPHFACRACGRVECLDSIEVPRVKATKNGYKIEQQEVYWKGLCSKCAHDSS